MRVRVLTLPFSGDRFDDGELSDLMKQNHIIDVRDHFFEHDGMPWLLLVISYRLLDPGDHRPERGRRSRSKPEAALDPEQRERYEQLRQWRKARSQTDGVPPYAIMLNRQLAEIAQVVPSTLSELNEIDGVGEARLERYGDDVLKVLRPKAEPPDLPGSDRTGGDEP